MCLKVKMYTDGDYSNASVQRFCINVNATSIENVRV